MMNVQELATASRYCPNLKIYVLDNKGYGMIRQTQNDWDGLDKDIATQPRMPDWYHLQKAFDIELTVVSIHANAKIEPKLKAGSEVWDQSPKLAPEEVGRIRATLRG
jgi:thiamine pyrophosphate-dependent acetolactate synthase large subunit-like protein